MAIDKLIFIYNANSGKFNSWMDTAHKLMSPSTYQCRLCDLTYDTFKENVEWVRFRESVTTAKKLRLEFLHKDEFEKQYRSKWLPKYEYPLILMSVDQGLEVLMSAAELNEMTTTGSLIDQITNKLQLL